MSFKPATRQGVKPLIGIYGESGCGKTYSALLLARGIVGPTGRIGLADSESGRGSLYADVLPGGYDVMEIKPPFSPANYVKTVDVAEDAGLDILVIDSASHEWEGINGVLDMASENESRSGKAGLHNWKMPKMEHQKFVLRLLQTRLPVIVCLRAKHKSRQVKNERGKTEIVKDDHASPIQAEDFIFEMTAHFEVLPNHGIVLTKCSHPDLRRCFPEDGREPVTIKHGELIAQWASAGKISGPQSQPERIRWEDATVLSIEPFSSGKQSGFIIESDKGKCWTDSDDLANQAEELRESATICTLVVSTDKKPKLIAIEDFEERTF